MTTPTDPTNGDPSPDFEFPTSITREQVRDALDRIATQGDRTVLATVIDNAASAYRAFVLEAREERAASHVRIRELASAVETAVELARDAAHTDTDKAARNAELDWLGLVARTAKGEDR